jgi:5,10-methylenetetrahydromethanopterin reductase
MSVRALSIGICYHREQPAGDVTAQALAVEELGYDEFWVIEDCFYTSGPSLAAAALAVTSTLTVGIGIMPAVARNPAIAAMEIATLCGIGPGRFHAGIGHGVSEWMDQMGVKPQSPLTMLEETLTAIRRLLRGERITVAGRYVTLHDVALVAPPAHVPLVSAGVRQPRSIALAAQFADGVILADYVNPTYVAQTRELLDAHSADARVTAFATMMVGSDGDLMRSIASHIAADSFADGHASLRALSFYEEVRQKAEAMGWQQALEKMPAAWWNQIGCIGTPDDAVVYLETMRTAGTDCITLFPNPDAAIHTAKEFARSVVSSIPRP